MDELANLVSQRTGLPPDRARTAIQTVVGFIKERLPAPMAGEIDRLMALGTSGGGQAGGNQGDLGEIGTLATELGGTFGTKA